MRRHDAPAALRAAVRYDRSAARVGIAHLGPGNFHRVHQAVYLDELFEQRPDQAGWAVLDIELLEGAQPERQARIMKTQDNLYTHTVVERDGSARTRTIGAVLGHLHAAADPGAAIAALADPAVRILTLTVTEGGYPLSVEGEFDPDHPDIRADLARAVPASAFGVIGAALARRRNTGLAPFTVLSCDNLPRNGAAARTATVGVAEAFDPTLARWVERHVAFPDSMVDRIAPAVDEAVRERLNARSGLPDGVPVLSESHRQWVIADEFVDGRPAWEDVGVEVGADVAAHVAVKQRLLNATHSLLAYPAALVGLTYMHEAVADPLLARLGRTFMADDVAPFLTGPPGVTLAAYAERVLDRLANAALHDTVLRVAADGAAKLPLFVGPTARAVLAGGDPRRLALLVACYRAHVRAAPRAALGDSEPHLSGTDEALLRAPDPRRALQAAPFAAWGLAGDERFGRTYDACVAALEERGVRAAVDEALR